MRPHAAAMALVTLAALACGVWASGCNGLTSDCELDLTCPTATTTTTAAPQCHGFLSPGDCASCVEAQCCQEMQDCALDSTCINDCLFNVWPPADVCNAGDTKKRLDTITTCFKGKCSSACRSLDECNPVTNDGCDTASGEACDAVYPGQFACLPSFGTLAGICQPCDNFYSPYCSPGLRCHAATHECARYCCTDADCGSGKCVIDPAVVFGLPLSVSGDNVGLCLDSAGTTPACDAPATSSSLGICVGGFPGG